MRRVIVACVSLASAPLLAWGAPAAVCKAPLVSPPPSVSALPFGAIARAAVQSVDDQTLKAATHQKDGDTVVRDCRGHEMVSGWLDYNPPRDPGQLVEGGRQKLSDGRLAVWIESGGDLGAPATLLHGFLAIARTDGASVVIDSIGPWENGEDAKRTLRRERSSSGPVFVEPTGHTGTGGGTDSAGLAVWVEKKGQLVRAGFFDTEGLDENLGNVGAHWRLNWKATVAYEDAIHLTETQTWTLVKGGRAEVARTIVERYFVVDGDKLNEVPAPSERKPPHPADAPGKRVTISVPMNGGDLSLTFDTARLSQETMRQLATMAPDGTPDVFTLIDSLELCVAGDPKYKECGTRDLSAAHFLENAAVNLQHSREQVVALRAQTVPDELEPAKLWLVRSANYYLDLSERLFAYAKTGNLEVLQRLSDNVDPKAACAPSLAKVSAAKDAASRFHVAQYDWYNCMNGAFADKRGEYPKKAWKQFITDYGIKAKFTGATGD